MNQYHALEGMEVVQSLGSRVGGLTHQEAEDRRERFGVNEISDESRITALRIFIRQFKSFLTVILIAAGGVSFLLGETVDGIAIAAIVVLNGVLGFIQEFRAERALEALKSLAAPHARVLRENQERVFEARDVVPGDIILLEAGDQVPADGRLLEVLSLRCDESPLTGESVPSSKFIESVPEKTPLADRENMVYSGTAVTYGRGKAVVVSTAMQTEFGRIAEIIQQTSEEETPLQSRLKALGVMLGGLALLVSAGLFAIQVSGGHPILESFMIAVALAVSAVPEGLPAVVTVTLALGVRKMSRANAIVRRLSSVETLGSTTVICTDKTGTLTRDEMTVTSVLAGGEYFEITGSGYEPKGQFLQNGSPVSPDANSCAALLLRIGALCNHASLQRASDWSVVGDPTEGALLTLAAKGGIHKDQLSQQYPLVGEVPFDSVRKRMTTVHEHEGRRIAYVKGAPETLLRLSGFLHIDVGTLELDDRARQKVLDTVGDLAADGLRVLALAYREIPPEISADLADLEQDLTFVGVVGMLDPPREEVRDAIATCRRAGIRTVMITGDHGLTARTIAEEIGLLKDGGRVISGPELDQFSDEALAREVEDVAVCARSSPEHKVRILKALKTRGHVVAMTGDGVNDAPALKQADIGIAMGITGTEVTKQASDMVLADDNFATIVRAIEEGRGIYDNIRKFIRLLLSTNLDEILLIATATVLRLPLPMLAIQILWVNIVSDGLPALALSFDPYEDDIMERSPRSPREGIFHGMLLFILAAAVIDFAAETALLLYWRDTGFVSVEKIRTMIFTSTILFELFFVLNCRSETHSVFRSRPLQNRLLVLAIVLSLLLQILVIYVPVLQAVFKTVPLDVRDWLIILAISASGLLVLPEVFMRTSRASSSLGEAA